MRGVRSGVSILVALVGTVIATLYWLSFKFVVQDNMGGFIETLFILFLPACLALGAALARARVLMVIAILWSLPVSLYLLLAARNLYKFCFVSVVCYIIALILMPKRESASTN
jgi:phage shock protein PspC (stress-responsive transcriptional regulator)